MALSDVAGYKETTTIELYEPGTLAILKNDDGSPMTVTVAGPHSEIYKKEVNRQKNLYLAMARKSGGRINQTAEKMDAEGERLLIACVTEWNITTDDGKPQPECTPENIADVFRRFTFIKSQIDDAFGDESRFLG